VSHPDADLLTQLAAQPLFGCLAGFEEATGRIREVVYLGMVTRYLVELDRGGELQVVRQNLETSSAEALDQQGRNVILEWRPEHQLELDREGEREGER